MRSPFGFPLLSVHRFAWTNPLENALLAAFNRFLSKKSVS
jgi:hypothetical protein